MSEYIEQDQNSEQEQETEITFIHTLPPEIIKKLRERQRDEKN